MRRERGFTLIEIIIAISILGLVMGIAYGGLSSITRTKQVLDDGRDARLLANAILGRLSRELQLAFGSVPLLPPRDTQDQTVSTRVNMLGEQNSGSDGEAQDRITFLALEGGQYLPDGGAHNGLVQITYRVEPDPDAPNDQAATYLLIREETPYIRPKERAYERTMIFPLTNRIVSLSFRYFDPESESWHNSWGDGDRVGLPTMVEYSLKLRALSGKISEFTSAVPVRPGYSP